jgi:hypothetical protein
MRQQEEVRPTHAAQQVLMTEGVLIGRTVQHPTGDQIQPIEQELIVALTQQTQRLGVDKPILVDLPAPMTEEAPTELTALSQEANRKEISAEWEIHLALENQLWTVRDSARHVAVDVQQ